MCGVKQENIIKTKTKKKLKHKQKSFYCFGLTYQERKETILQLVYVGEGGLGVGEFEGVPDRLCIGYKGRGGGGGNWVRRGYVVCEWFL